MANFIKVGDRFINLDLVTDVQIDKQRIAKLGRIAIAITLNVPEPKGVGASDWFVEAVLEWLDLGAIDVVQQYRERAERDNPERFA
jgi:fructosamine-3-kinase